MALYVGGVAVTGTQVLDATKLSGNLPALNSSSLTSLTPANLASAVPVNKGGTALTSGFINGVSAPSSHTSISFANGYAAEGSGTTRNVVFKLSGIVYVMVYCSRSSTPDNNMVVGTLPSGYRPASTKYVGTSIGYQADSTANINVSTNGDIKIGSPNNPGDSTFYVALSFFFPLAD